MLSLRKNMATPSMEFRMYLAITLTLFLFASVNCQTPSTDDESSFVSPYQDKDLDEQSSNTKAPTSADETTQAAQELTTSSPADRADFTIRDDNGKACIRACFSAVFNVFYTKKQNKNAQVKVPLPSKATAIGTCGSVNDHALLTIQWNEGKFNLKFAFENKTENGKESWKVKKLQFSYNTSDDTYFEDAAGGGMKTVQSEDDDDDMFKTPAEKSRKCETEDDIELVGIGNSTDKAILELRQLQLQPYHLLNDSFSKAQLCKNDKEALGTNIASIAVGATLALVILVVITGYAIGRRMGAITDRTSYSSME
ncbi:lysosome-associated membrane glycoprotein 5 [Strongylocentrotus purpuratus]|uniref:Lysosome-associated membrane glycoprotein 5 n=1 Tax=Strongylocentrotus purpuratus TaxID=7668 RepID=A0A7M7REJ8_STRPU|nr:lysosome-associated membrane glycoprotein 5 [Strongylocentrotus purpuratus]